MVKTKMEDLIGKNVKVKIIGEHANVRWNKKGNAGVRSLWRRLDMDDKGRFYIDYRKNRVLVKEGKDLSDGAYNSEHEIYLKSYVEGGE